MVAEVSEGRVRACARNGCEVGAFFFVSFFFLPSFLRWQGYATLPFLLSFGVERPFCARLCA
jgi:hypothetical protein